MNTIFIYYYCYYYFSFATISKDLLAIIKLLCCPLFWWEDVNTYLHSSVITFRPTSLLASYRYSVFSFVMFMLSFSMLTSSATTMS